MANKVKRVLGDKVFLIKPPVENKLEGGFIMPTVSTNVGVVKFIGEDLAASSSCPVRLGQKVVYSTEYETLQMENQDVYVMELGNVLAILED